MKCSSVIVPKHNLYMNADYYVSKGLRPIIKPVCYMLMLPPEIEHRRSVYIINKFMAKVKMK
jgi:hypothetical protein